MENVIEYIMSFRGINNNGFFYIDYWLFVGQISILIVGFGILSVSFLLALKALVESIYLGEEVVPFGFQEVFDDLCVSISYLLLLVIHMASGLLIVLLALGSWYIIILAVLTASIYYGGRAIRNSREKSTPPNHFSQKRSDEENHYNRLMNS